MPIDDKVTDEWLSDLESKATRQFNEVCAWMHTFKDEYHKSYCEKRECKDCAIYQTREKVYGIITGEKK